jgi:hypothetical protein
MTPFSGVGNGEVCSADSDLLPKGPVLQDAARVTRDKCLHPPTQPECGAFAVIGVTEERSKSRHGVELLGCWRVDVDVPNVRTCGATHDAGPPR